MMADVIAAAYSRYDSFIILMGTDTMAYAASALSFMFENLTKNIVFTGSKVPIPVSFFFCPSSHVYK